MTSVPLRGLYAITSAELCRDPARLLAAAEAALRGGARLLQYRDKASDAVRRRSNATALAARCRAHEAHLMINDDVELAAELGVGVHLGKTDTPLRAARQRLGASALIGVSCANVLDRAIAAQADGASYVAFGRFFPSRTKPDAPQANPPLLCEAKARLRVPICAIGGITPALAPRVIEAGADLVAAVEGVFGAPDVETAARAYARLFDQ